MGHTELNNLADEYYEWSLRTHPNEATMRGVHEHDAELDEFSREAEDKQISYLRSVAGRAEDIDENGLSASDRVTRDVLIFETGSGADAMQTRLAELAVDPAFGIQVILTVLVPQIPIETKASRRLHCPIQPATPGDCRGERPSRRGSGERPNPDDVGSREDRQPARRNACSPCRPEPVHGGPATTRPGRG